MKKINKRKFLSGLKAILILLYLISLDVNIFSQPGVPADHGQNGNQSGGGVAPLGDGLIFFLIGACFYGIKQLISRRKIREDT